MNAERVVMELAWIIVVLGGTVAVVNLVLALIREVTR
jgi:hypothetical protein